MSWIIFDSIIKQFIRENLVQMKKFEEDSDNQKKPVLLPKLSIAHRNHLDICHR